MAAIMPNLLSPRHQTSAASFYGNAQWDGETNGEELGTQGHPTKANRRRRAGGLKESWLSRDDPEQDFARGKNAERITQNTAE
jgi:hypothetical protein